jgi:hypothetical protein
MFKWVFSPREVGPDVQHLALYKSLALSAAAILEIMSHRVPSDLYIPTCRIELSKRAMR